MFSIYGDSQVFYQWDLGRKLIVEDNTIPQVHFCNHTEDCSIVMETYQEGELTLVNIPNKILQDSFRFHVYAYDGQKTKHQEFYEIIPRSKPTDYCYTEEGVINYEIINQELEAMQTQIDNLSEGAIGTAVEEYLAEHPLEAPVMSVNDKVGEVVLTAEDVNALPADTVIPSVEGLASTEYVDEAVDSIVIPDITGLASEQYVNEAIAAIPETDLSNYYTKEETNELIPDTSDFATTGYVDAAVANVEVDLSDYYTKQETDQKIAEAQLGGEVDLSNYYTKEETDNLIPDTSGFITEIPSEYVTDEELNAKGYLTEHQSLEGYATEEYVDEAIANIPGGGGGGDGTPPDEKTIITNAEGKLETVIGGSIATTIPAVAIVNETGLSITSDERYPVVPSTNLSGKTDWVENAAIPMDFKFSIHIASSNTDMTYEYKNIRYDSTQDGYPFNDSTNNYITQVKISSSNSASVVWYLVHGSSWTHNADTVTELIVNTSVNYTYNPIKSEVIPVDGATILNNTGVLKTSLPLKAGYGTNCIETLAQNSQATKGKNNANFGSYNSFGSSTNDSFTAGNQNTISTYYYGAAFGEKNTLSGSSSNFAAGGENNVRNDYGVALGYKNDVYGNSSFAAGRNNKIGGYSFTTSCCAAIGKGLTLESSNEAAIGKFNLLSDTVSYAFTIGNGESSSAQSNALTVDWNGNANAAGSFTGGGADYAEYFEWVDGNPEEEDRVGLLVALDGNKIKLAQPGDEVLGIVSGTALILGDNAEWNWQGRFLTDDFGRVIYDMVEEFTEIVEIDEEGNEAIKTVSNGFFPHPRANPEYNPDKPYVRRADRAEWEAIGLMGKLYVRDDNTCAVGGYAAPAANGIATSTTTKTNMRVMERVKDNIIRVLMK